MFHVCLLLFFGNVFLITKCVCYRVLRRGGRFLCLELSHVEAPIFKELYVTSTLLLGKNSIFHHLIYPSTNSNYVMNLNLFVYYLFIFDKK